MANETRAALAALTALVHPLIPLMVRGSSNSQLVRVHARRASLASVVAFLCGVAAFFLSPRSSPVGVLMLLVFVAVQVDQANLARHARGPRRLDGRASRRRADEVQ